jgi:hypothetical protein
MSTTPVSNGAAIHPSLLDALSECYLDWKETCFEVARAYSRWQRAPRSIRASAFAAYEAALDVEQSASDAYAELIAAATVP